MDRFQQFADAMNSTLSALPTGPLPWWGWLAIGMASLVVVKMLLRRATGGNKNFASVEPDQEGMFGSFTDALAAQLPESKEGGIEFQRMVKQAGMYHPSAAVSLYALRFVLLIVPMVIAGIASLYFPPEHTTRIMIGGVIAAAMFSIIPRLYVFFRRRSRQNEIRAGLSDMMDMLSMCLGGGMPLASGLEHVAENLVDYPTLAEEIRILKRQSDVSSLKIALADMSRRIDMPEVRQLAGLLNRSDRLGTKISSSLHDQSDHYRSQRRQWATSQANKTPVKLMFPLMFCFAPAALILLISPAMMDLNDFFYPTDGSESILTGNETLDTDQIVQSLSELDQSGIQP